MREGENCMAVAGRDDDDAQVGSRGIADEGLDTCVKSVISVPAEAKSNAMNPKIMSMFRSDPFLWQPHCTNLSRGTRN